MARKNGPIRLKLLDLKTIDLVVQREAWVAVDRACNDLPVLAWTDFEGLRHRALHEPVLCELRYFHGLAGMVVKRLLDLLESRLRERLHDASAEPAVLQFPTR